MDAEARTRVMAPAGLAIAALGGLGGVLLAAGGRTGPGLVVWAAGAAAGAAGLWWGWRRRAARTLPQLVAQAQGDAEHPQAGLVQEIRGLVGRIEAHGLSVREVVRQVQEHATLIAWVIDALNRAVANARESLVSMQAAMERVGEHAGEVMTASQKGVDNLESMGSSTEELFEGAETLNRSVEEATGSVVQIHEALSGVLEGVSLLSEASDRTTEFVAQVGEAMGGIRGRIDQNLSLAQKVEESARRGREVVDRVGQGVRAIRSTSEEMMESIHALGQQSHEIEGVIGIITDVAEETNLLSLNAAILAAQAGDQGAAFGVVADQIRSLARGTRESTKHVEELIRGIQANIAQANLGLTANLEAVEEGEEMGREAERQLELIAGTVDESVGESREIVRAAQATHEKSATMVSAAGEVNESLHRVAETLTESLQEVDRVQALIQSLAALSQSVRAATARHRETGRNTSELIGSFAEEVEGIEGLLVGQDQTASQLETALGEVSESSDSTRESLDALHELLKELVRQADGIREEVGCSGREAKAKEGTVSKGEGRRVSETRAEVAAMMQPHHANPAGNVHGGQIMKMIDDAGGVVAIRHARSNVVTASIDRLDFHAPVYVGNLVVLKASVNCVGRTSMEVGVRVEAEDLRTGEVRHTASAYLTFVSLDENGKPRDLPELILETEEDRRRCAEGQGRREQRARAR